MKFSQKVPVNSVVLLVGSLPAESTVPPEDLAIQWDMAYETQDIEGVLAWTSEGAWERYERPVARLTGLIPEEVLVGYHL